MWNSLLKFTLVSYIWKRYRLTIIALPILLLYFWVVNVVHKDIISYATLNGDTSWLGWSFLVKWLVIFIGVGVFVFVHQLGKVPSENTLSETFKIKEKQFAESGVNENQATDDKATHDAFTQIRNKKHLRSKADIVLEKSRNKS